MKETSFIVLVCLFVVFKGYTQSLPEPNYFIGRWEGIYTDRVDYHGGEKRGMSCILEFKDDGTIIVEKYLRSVRVYYSWLLTYKDELYLKAGTGSYKFKDGVIRIILTLRFLTEQSLSDEKVVCETEYAFNIFNDEFTLKDGLSVGEYQSRYERFMKLE
jgi:hypothetical protein